MLVAFGICFKQHFDTRYLLFYNPSPPRMFLSLDLLWEYRIQHGANEPLYVTSRYSIWIFCRGVSGFATDCPCGVWCRGLTTCLLHVVPPFGNRILNNSWMDNIYFFVCFDLCNYICLDTSDHFSVLPSSIFFIFSCTLVLTSSIDVVFMLSIKATGRLFHGQMSEWNLIYDQPVK